MAKNPPKQKSKINPRSSTILNSGIRKTLNEALERTGMVAKRDSHGTIGRNKRWRIAELERSLLGDPQDQW